MPVLDVPAIPDLPIYQLSVDQYHELIRTRVLDKDDRIELLHGWMVPKLSNNPPHSVATELTAQALRTCIPSGYSLRSEKPITLSDSEPEPDIAIVVGSPRNYTDRHPVPGEIALVVEISDSTLNRDRKIKKEVYANAGIPLYWIVDVTSRKVEVYTQPTGSVYQSCEEFSAQVPLRIGDHPPIAITVADLLP